MKSIRFSVALLCTIVLQINALGQQAKPAIDTAAINSWPSIESGSITRNGDYLMYSVVNQPTGKKTTIIKAVKGNWKKTFISEQSSNAKFSLNGTYCIRRSEDTLMLLKLGSSEMRSIYNVTVYKDCIGSNKQWLSYTLKESPTVVHLINLIDKQEKTFNNIKDYEFSANGNVLLLQAIHKSEIELQFIELNTGIIKTIWEGNNLASIIWHSRKSELFFLTKDDGDAGSRTVLFQYKARSEKAIPITGDLNSLYDGYQLQGVSGISTDGDRIYLNFVEVVAEGHGDQKQNVTVFNYLDDSFLVNERRSNNPKTLTYCFNCISKKYVLLKSRNENIQFFQNSLKDTLAVLSKLNGLDIAETKRQGLGLNQYWLISTLTGKKIATNIGYREVSPAGKYVVGYDDLKGTIILYDIERASEINISDIVINELKHFSNAKLAEGGVRLLAWLPDDSAMLVSDEFDIWKVYLTSKKHPINITNGYCRKNNLNADILGFQIWDYVFRSERNNNVILRVKNAVSKMTGFFTANLIKGGDPIKLTMDKCNYGAFAYNFSSMGENWSNNSFQRDFIILKESVREFPNLYVTKDFISFKQVSDIHPEQKYNWMNSEIISYSTEDTICNQAVVFKPEDFDPAKTYPIIFYYYEELASRAYQYHRPELCSGGINIPWFVSHGYVVCTPDIFNNKGHPGKTALDAVMGAYNILKRNSWFDSSRTAICGHSFGGFETNYIITHSDAFAAAYSGSSLSDIVSFYGSVNREGLFNSAYVEVGQLFLKGDLWEKKKYYLQNSPVLYANSVKTPLLLMANYGDKIVPFEQSVEFFTALRRLGKSTWMLTYDNEEHTIEEYHNQLDFTLKLTDFLDYYLKKTAIPHWMLLPKK